MIGRPQVRPSSLERCTISRLPAPTVSELNSQTSCLSSYATTGSLTRGYGPGGSASTVVYGRNPCVQVSPPSCDVANPLLVAPPFEKRPVWKPATTVSPQANVSASTCVWW